MFPEPRAAAVMRSVSSVVLNTLTHPGVSGTGPTASGRREFAPKSPHWPPGARSKIPHGDCAPAGRARGGVSEPPESSRLAHRSSTPRQRRRRRGSAIAGSAVGSSGGGPRWVIEEATERSWAKRGFKRIDNSTGDNRSTAQPSKDVSACRSPYSRRHTVFNTYRTIAVNSKARPRPSRRAHSVRFRQSLRPLASCAMASGAPVSAS